MVRLTPLLSCLCTVLLAFRAATRRRSDLVLENIALRQQLGVYQRQSRRPPLRRTDRAFWVALMRLWPRWRSALLIVQPATVLAWHRRGFAAFWRRRSSGSIGRPRIPRHHIAFIRQMSRDHPEWGEDRIALELHLKLGVKHSTSTVRRYMVDGGRPGGSTWSSFLQRHAPDLWAMDFTTVALWNYEVRYVLIILHHETRRVVHHAVTAHPNLEWLKHQLREAMPWDEGPRFLLHDNDGIYGQLGRGGRFRSTLDTWLYDVLGVRGLPTPYRAPNANAVVERFMGTLRREALHHFMFRSTHHLNQVVAEFVAYYNEHRPHQGVHRLLAPQSSALDPPPPPQADAHLTARPILGGVHHDYRIAS